ncbi:MAG: NAD(+)/NADH kinase [Nitrospirae bacterium]|nr:NAD(+)/NADH kinase [Nitrospirota bacterium]NTW67068.1 NAD(+)/NADH kinase [Nitrospirota bacterium]
MKKIGIIAKDIPRAHDAVRKLSKWLTAKGRKVFLEDRTAASLDLTGHAPRKLPSLVDMIIVLGGDGTLLSAARLVADSRKNVPIFGVNLGSLGFMAEVPLEELYGNLEKALAGKLRADERMMLFASVIRKGKTIAEHTVLNDAVVSKGTFARMVSLEVSVGDDYLTAIRADGLILATPTGSTAYSLSAGGPIIHPALHCFVVTPICPHTLSNRPIVIPDSSVVRVKLLSRSEGASLSFDGQVVTALRQNDVVEVKKAKYRVRLIKHPTKNYYEILRTKLKWGN